MITGLENDLAEVQIDVVNGTDGTDVEGISKTGILLCESHTDVRLLLRIFRTFVRVMISTS